RQAERRHHTVLEQITATRFEGTAQRGHHACRIDLMIAGTADTSDDRRPQTGLEAARLCAAEPARGETEALLQVIAAAQPLDLVARERHHERTVVAIVDGTSRVGLQRT